MRRRVILTPPAQDDQQRIRAWFQQPGSGTIEAALTGLAAFPLGHGPGSVPGTRPTITQGYKLLDAVEPDPAGLAEAGDVVLRIQGPGQPGT